MQLRALFEETAKLLSSALSLQTVSKVQDSGCINHMPQTFGITPGGNFILGTVTPATLIFVIA